jgi:hypothetical protein
MHTQQNTSLDELAGAIAAALPDLDPAGQRLAITLYRLLAAGRPVAADLAAAAWLPEPAVAETLGSWPRRVHRRPGPGDRVLGPGDQRAVPGAPVRVRRAGPDVLAHAG